MKNLYSMKDLYSLAIDGEVVAENMKLDFASLIVTALTANGMMSKAVNEITIQRVSENDE